MKVISGNLVPSFKENKTDTRNYIYNSKPIGGTTAKNFDVNIESHDVLFFKLTPVK
jgi:hypothetical protein